MLYLVKNNYALGVNVPFSSHAPVTLVNSGWTGVPVNICVKFAHGSGVVLGYRGHIPRLSEHKVDRGDDIRYLVRCREYARRALAKYTCRHKAVAGICKQPQHLSGYHGDRISEDRVQKLTVDVFKVYILPQLCREWQKQKRPSFLYYMKDLHTSS